MAVRLILCAGAVCAAGTVAMATESSSRIQIEGVKSVKVASFTRTVANSQAAPTHEPVVVGGILPLNYFMLINPHKYDLPRPSDGWVYFEAENEIYRVYLSSREILERVTDKAAGYN